MKTKRTKRQKFALDREDLALAGAPFFGGDFPYFGGEAAGNVVAIFGGHHSHELLFGNAAGGDIAVGFRSAQDRETESTEPEFCDRFAGFGHEALTLPG